MKRHVALTGFMASGKSTIGRKLARRLVCAFFDTDALIARAHGSIPAIFQDEGERAFREYERSAIATALESVETRVIALGGGALTLPENRRIVRDRAHCIFIKVAPEQILARVRRSREIRPLLGSTPTLERIKELYATRMPEYESADYVVDAARRSDTHVIAEILEWLRRQNLGLPALAS
jgi:shikimate kinase